MRAEPRRGVRAAQHDAVQHARKDDIVGVAAVALQQARVLDATDGLGEAELVMDAVSRARLRWVAEHAHFGCERPRGMEDRRLCVLNAGSSSLKFAVYAIADGRLHRTQSGEVERVGGEGRLLVSDADGSPVHDRTVNTADHAAALAGAGGIARRPA